MTSDTDPFPQLPPEEELLVNFRFGVSFLIGGQQANLIDTRFQRVSGLTASIETTTLNEGGLNLYSHRLPKRVSYENLVLERGFLVRSPLKGVFTDALGLFKFKPCNVMVSLLDEERKPLLSWLFIKAFPVRWSTADLSANDDKVLIDTLELAYTRFDAMRL